MRAVNLLPAPRVETRQDDGQSLARATKAAAIAAGLMVTCVTGLSSRSRSSSHTNKIDQIAQTNQRNLLPALLCEQ